MIYEDIVSMELLYQIQKYIKTNNLTLHEFYENKGLPEQLINKVIQKKELTYKEIIIICDSIKIPLDTLRTGPMDTIEFKILVHEVTLLEKKQKSILLPLYKKRFKRRLREIVHEENLNRYLNWLSYSVTKYNDRRSIH